MTQTNLVLTVHNIHTWGKPFLTRSGDLDLLQSVGLEIARRNQTQNYKLIYAAITDENLEKAQKLYPFAEFIYYKDYVPQSNDVFFVSTIDTRGQEEVFHDEFLDYFSYLSKKRHIVLNINHDGMYYLDLKLTLEMKKYNDLLASVQNLISTTEMYLVHDHSCLKESLNMHDMVDTFKIPIDKMYSFGQLVFYDAYLDHDLDKSNKSLLDIESITFNRPSKYKGFDLWLNRMLERPDISQKSVYICKIDMLSNLDDIKSSVQNKGYNFDNFNIYNSTEEYVTNKKQNSLPHIINSPYSHDDNFFNYMHQSCKTYLVASNYDFITAQYLIFENALVRALQMGLTLRWIPQSIEKMNQDSQQEALMLNKMTLSEQRLYVKEKLSVAKWLNNIYSTLS